MPGEAFDLEGTLGDLLSRSEGILDLAKIHRSKWDKLTAANQRYSLAIDERNRLLQAEAVAPNDRARANLQQKLKLAKLKINLFDRRLDRDWRLAKETSDPVADLISDVKLFLTRVPRDDSWMRLSQAILGIDLMQTTMFIAGTWPDLEESLLTLRLRLREMHELAAIRKRNYSTVASIQTGSEPEAEGEPTRRQGPVRGSTLSGSPSQTSGVFEDREEEYRVASAVSEGDLWAVRGGRKRLKAARLRLGHTLKDAAEKCKVAPGTYKKWERGRRPADRNIAAALRYIATRARRSADIGKPKVQAAEPR